MKKVLLLGDSIRMGYDKYVKMALEDVAEVVYPWENCRFTTYIIRQLREWQETLHWDPDMDLVHWNAGLWDDLRMIDGEPLVSLDDYKRNIERICKLISMVFPKAKMVFATSTPVQEKLFKKEKRLNCDTERYNAAAVEIVKRYGGEINDLYTLAVNAPVEYHSDLTHYYTKEGTKLLTEQVVSVIESALEIQGKKLDYDALFEKKEDVVGQ